MEARKAALILMKNSHLDRTPQYRHTAYVHIERSSTVSLMFFVKEVKGCIRFTDYEEVLVVNEELEACRDPFEVPSGWRLLRQKLRLFRPLSHARPQARRLRPQRQEHAHRHRRRPKRQFRGQSGSPERQ